MSKDIRIRKGLNINIVGEPDKVYASVPLSSKYIIKPTDFHSLTPKLKIKVGDHVKAGDVLFCDKYNEVINFCSPVSGKIINVERGEKRKITKIIVQAENDITYKDFPTISAKNTSREEVIKHMLNAGVWPFIRQRPYDVIANPHDMPKAIFISSFNSAPLTVDNDFALYGMTDLFQKGLDFIVKLTKGKTYLNLDGNTNSSKIFSEAKGVEINTFSGPHPSGNVGVQMHHIDPINKGDIVWYLEPQDIITIARLFIEGKLDLSRIICVAGPQVKRPRYYRTIIGSVVNNLLSNNLKEGDNRIISGDIFTGKKISINDALGFYDTTLTVIKEGKNQEFLGWLLPGFHKFSASRSFLSWLTPSKQYNIDANMHGEERAYVATGQYEKVLPMDIYPNQLIKAILMEDIDLMENLGIYELSPEDLALCEFVCTSKVEVQTILRYGLDLIRKENS